MAARTYSPTNGTINLSDVYGVNASKDKTMRELGYTTYQQAKDFAPAFAGYWEARGWDTNDFLDLYLIEVAWNDAVWSTDTLMGLWGYYRPNWITQSRAWIEAPDGWYRLRWGLLTGLGRYSGKLSNVWSNRTNNVPSCTPGTALEIDHIGWFTKYAKDRICLTSSAWASDYSTVGGIAYQEGVIIENFRTVGGMSGKPRDTTFKSYGVTVSNPGECSEVRNCFSTDFNDSGFAVISGTPGRFTLCSSFYNKEAGFLCYSNNGLSNTTFDEPSGDDNKTLFLMRPLPNSVSGGTYTINGFKLESRDVMQKLMVVEGPLGMLNVTITGGTADHARLTCPELIEIQAGTEFSIDVRGLEYGNNVQSLLYHAPSGKRLTGGNAFRGNAFGLTEEGLYLKGRNNMAWGGSVVTPPVDPPVDPPVNPPTGTNLDRTGWSAAASSTDGTNTATKALDGQPSTFWMSNGSMTTSGPTLTVDMKAVKTFKGLTFACNTGYPNSWPRTFEVFTSDTGVETSFTSRGTFNGALNSVATWATAITGRFVRVKCKTANQNWMNCAEFNVQA